MASCHTHATCYGIFSHRIRRIHRTSCREEPPTDFTDLHRTYGALFSHRIHRIHRIWQRGYGRDAIPSYICEHLCHLCHLWESFLCKRFREFRAFCGNLFPPMDFSLGGYGILPYPRHLLWDILPQNTPNSQNLLQRCPPTDFTDLHRYLWCAVLQQNTEFGSVGMAGMPYPPTSVLICVICGRFFSARGSVYSAYSVGEYPIAGGVGMAGMPYPPTSVNIRAVCGRLFSARGSVSSVLICGRLFSARSFCAFRAFCGNIFSPTEFTESTEFVSVGIAGMPYPPNLCASVPSVGVLSLQEVLCIRCIPWELLHRLFGWCS